MEHGQFLCCKPLQVRIRARWTSIWKNSALQTTFVTKLQEVNGGLGEFCQRAILTSLIFDLPSLFHSVSFKEISIQEFPSSSLQISRSGHDGQTLCRSTGACGASWGAVAVAFPPSPCCEVQSVTSYLQALDDKLLYELSGFLSEEFQRATGGGKTRSSKFWQIINV